MLPDSELLKHWQSISELGFWLVIIGVFGESVDLVAKWWVRRRQHDLPQFAERWMLPLESIFWIILCVGLAMEFLGGHEAMLVSDRQNAELTDRSAIANLEAKRAGTNAAASYERAAIAEREAARANERAAKLEVEKVELYRQLNLIWDQSRPRWLFKSGIIEAELKNKTKGVAEILYLDSDQDCYFTSIVLQAAIINAGWHVQSFKSITVESARKLGNLEGVELISKKDDTAMLALLEALVKSNISVTPGADNSYKDGDVKIVVGQHW